MHTIYKYPVLLSDTFSLLLPAGARVLTVQTQYGTPQLWALVNPERQLVRRNFRVAGTGHPIDSPETLQFINTFQVEGGTLVFHVFEVIE